MMKNQKGITLIALVITIIVLLILAGVSIAMLTSENGILKRAQETGEATIVGEVEETIKLAVSEITSNKLDPSYSGTEDVINKTTIAAKMLSNNKNISTTVTADKSDDIEVTVTDDSSTTLTKVTVSYTHPTSGTKHEWEITASTGKVTKTA